MCSDNVSYDSPSTKDESTVRPEKNHGNPMDGKTERMSNEKNMHRAHRPKQFYLWCSCCFCCCFCCCFWQSPIYGVTSFLSLVLPPSAEPYLGILKDFYESYVIYQFLSFLVAVMGRGDRGTVVASLAHHVDHLKPPFKCLYFLFHPRPEESDEAMANAVLLECQFLAMQFVFFKPATAIVSFVLEVVDASSSGSGDKKWAFFYSPQFFVILIENISVFLAFSGLLKVRSSR